MYLVNIDWHSPISAFAYRKSIHPLENHEPTCPTPGTVCGTWVQRQVRKSFSQSTSTLFGETNTYKNNYSLWERQVQRTMIAGGGEVTTKRVAGGWKLHEYVKFQPGLQESQELAWWWKEGKRFVHTSRRVYTSPCLQGSLGIQAGAVCPTTCLLTMSKLQLA